MNGDKKLSVGLECLRCFSVVFDIDALLKHLRDNAGHSWYRFGTIGAVYVEILLKRSEWENTK